MAYPELSFAPDRRSVQATFYHFSERPSGDPDRRGFSQQDSLIYALDKIYQSKFTNIPPQLRNTLVNILVTEVPLAHNNPTILAAANFIVYHMRLNQITIRTTGTEFDPRERQIFDSYFNYVAQFLITDVSGKTPGEIQKIRANFKITLLRYVIFIINNTTNYMPAVQAVGPQSAMAPAVQVVPTTTVQPVTVALP